MDKRVLGISMAAIILVSLCAVYASTSVSAKPGKLDKPGKPNQMTGDPAVCGESDLNLFIKGKYEDTVKDRIWYRHWNVKNGWSRHWTDLGYPQGVSISSSPSAATSSYGGSGVRVAVRGDDGAIWVNSYWSDTSYLGWQGWWKVPGTEEQVLIGTAPAITEGEHSMLRPFRYFFTGTDQTVKMLLSDDSGDVTTINPPGVQRHTIYSPAAAFYSSDYTSGLYVAILGTDGHLYTTVSIDGGATWRPWQDKTPPVAIDSKTRLSLASPPHEGAVKLFYTGTDHMVYWGLVDSPLGVWQSLGGPNRGSPVLGSPAVTSHYATSPLIIQVFVQGNDGDIWSKHSHKPWTTWEPWDEELHI